MHFKFYMEQLHESLDDIKNHYENRYPDLNKSWMKIVNTVGTGLVNEIKERAEIDNNFIKQFLGFNLRIVVDNNFVLAQIMGTLKKKGKIEDSLLYRLLLSKSMQIFAPHFLKEELFAKIDTEVSAKDKKVAIKYAILLTSKISFKDAQ